MAARVEGGSGGGGGVGDGGPVDERMRAALYQCPWMNKDVRRWLVAMRPWSFPATLVPVALTGAVLHKSHGVDLLTLNYTSTWFMLLAAHGGANLTNTYFDYKNGADKKEADCDDRSLVDGVVKCVSACACAVFCPQTLPRCR